MRFDRTGIRFISSLGAALLVAAVLYGCGQQNRITSPEVDVQVGMGGSGLKPVTIEALKATMVVQDRHTPSLLNLPGVVGTATSVDEAGNPVIMILTETKMPAGRLPKVLDGFGVVEEVTGKIMALKGGGSGTNHRAKQTPPIQLGTSGGPALDLANGYCCGGTLGSLVQIGSTQYILSNSHVFAGDVTSGGNGRVSTIGDDITQPGLIDVSCNAGNAQVVADLSSLSTLYPPNSTPNLDASIAQVRSGMVRTDGAILGIGTLSSATVAASVNMAVKKSGRTTGLTRSTISGINANISVGYSTECAGSSFTKSFTGQILISNSGNRFLNSGDSGSLMVQDVTSNPRAVGLLYAGSSSIAVANPIGTVLGHFGASMVGQ
jgi:hypothetical protein